MATANTKTKTAAGRGGGRPGTPGGTRSRSAKSGTGTTAARKRGTKINADNVGRGHPAPLPAMLKQLHGLEPEMRDRFFTAADKLGMGPQEYLGRQGWLEPSSQTGTGARAIA